jgi:hypothetical protein
MDSVEKMQNALRATRDIYIVLCNKHCDKGRFDLAKIELDRAIVLGTLLCDLEATEMLTGRLSKEND